MESKVKKISGKLLRINAFNLPLFMRGITFLFLFIWFVISGFCNGVTLSLKIFFIIVLMSVGIYILFLKDWFIGYTKYIQIDKNYISIGKRIILKENLSHVSLVVSSINAVSVTTSYRLELVLEKGFFKNISLISFTSSEKQLAEQAGKDIADFLGIEFKGLDSIWE